MGDMRTLIYTRISRDPRGRRLGVERQEEQCRAQAAVLGWEVVGVYEDNDTSATKEKDPPQYVAMLRACEAGMADAILVLTVDRLHRQLWKFAPFMKWRKKHGIAFATTEGDNTETSNGRFILNIKASMAEAEAERISERVTASVRQRALSGGFHGGGIPFGQNAIKSTINGEERIVEIQRHPQHSKWLKEAASRVLAGETIYGICKDWNKKGRRTREGNPWSTRTLRRILVNPNTIGMRVYQGELRSAPWKPILDHTTWEALCAILNDPDRKTSHDSKRRYMLSGLVHCGRCGNVMTSTPEKKKQGAGFECSAKTGFERACGRMRIVMDPVEAFVTEQLFFVLDSDEFNKELTTPPTNEVAALRDAINADQATVKRLADEYDDRLMTEAEYKRRTARITDRLNTNLAQWSMLRRTVTLPPADELRRVWPDKDDVWRRTIVSAVIERVDVHPHPRGTTSAPPRRSGEPLSQWRARFHAARMATMAERITVHWLA